MSRLLLLATLLATGAAAQTPALEALHGTWEATRDTTITQVFDGTAYTSTIIYESVDLSATTLTSLTISIPLGGTGPQASESRDPIRADGLTMHLNDSTHVDLEPVGERLRVRWVWGDEVRADVLMERAPPRGVPEALRGDWYTIISAPGGGIDLVVHVEEDSVFVGREDYRALFVDDFLLLAGENDSDPSGMYQGYDVFAIRWEGEGVVLTGDDQTMRLVPLRR